LELYLFSNPLVVTPTLQPETPTTTTNGTKEPPAKAQSVPSTRFKTPEKIIADTENYLKDVVAKAEKSVRRINFLVHH
jgi:hypothetical protein